MKSNDTSTAPNPRKQRLERQIAALEAALDNIDPAIKDGDCSEFQRTAEILHQKKQLLKAITWR
ncbi:MAG: hypothetical protein OET44_15175 [Gammaproteobacteria bacterium]|nr:hypothetical protein [Gammaproteobacteria bacterium]